MLEDLEEFSDCGIFVDVLKCVEKEVFNIKVFIYERLEWLKRVFLFFVLVDEGFFDMLMEYDYGVSSLRVGLLGGVFLDKVGAIELLIFLVFRVVVLLYFVGFIDFDVVVFFLFDEVFFFYNILFLFFEL